jgi:MFS family permease
VTTAPAQAGIWRHDTLRGLLAAETVSVFGSALSLVAVPWLVLTLTHSPRDMGLVMGAGLTGTALFGVLGASWAGRLGPRRVMVLGDCMRGSLITLLPVLAACGRLTVGAIALVMFAMGGFWAPYAASQQSVLPSVTGEDEDLLSRATAVLESAMRLSLMIGPPLAGLLVGLLGPARVIVLDAASFGVSVLLLRRYLPAAEPVRPPPDRRSFTAGVRTLRSDPLLATWSVALTLSEFAWQGLFAAIPVIALTLGHGRPVVAGLLSGAFASGALLGTLLVGPLLRRLSVSVLAVAGRGLLALSFLGLLLPLGVTTLICCLAVAGLLNGVSSAPVTTVRALRVPAHLRSETITVATALAMTGATAGWLVTGSAIHAVGLRGVFLGLAAAQVAAALLHAIGLAAVRHRHSHVANRATEPDPRGGPDDSARQGRPA